jgi:hypothetical protein
MQSSLLAFDTFRKSISAKAAVHGICARFARNFSELRGCRIQVQATCLANLCPIGMIEEIVRLGAKFESIPLIDGELLERREIPVLKARPVNLVAHPRLKVKRSRARWRREWRSARVCGGEILSRATWACESSQDIRGAVQYPELAFVAATKTAKLAHTSIVVVATNPTRSPSLELSATAKFPAAKQLTSKRVLRFEERQIIKIVDD